MGRLVVAVAVLLALVTIQAVLAMTPPPPEYRKKLQGPPSEFERHRIPSPETAGLVSESAMYDLVFARAQDGSYVWEGDVVVDSPESLDISLFSPYEDDLDIIVQPPGQLPFSLTLAESTSRLHGQGIGAPYVPPFLTERGPFGIDGASYPVTTYNFINPAIGTWKAKVIIRAENVPTDSPAAIAMITNTASLQLFSHLNHYELEVGQEIGLVANLFDQRANIQEGVRPAALITASLQPSMIVNYPSGRQVHVPMHDDGVHADFLPSDGVYGSVVEALEPGQYTVRAVFEGVTESGIRFVRSTEHSFHVVNPYITLTGLSSVEYSAKEKSFFFDVDVDLYPEENTAVKAYAEVWGTDASGYAYTPIAWVQAMVDPHQAAPGEYVITLQLHEDWVHNAKATAPFQLRNVWIQDRDWNVVMSERSAIFVDSAALQSYDFSSRAHSVPVPITEEMRVGRRPTAMLNRTRIAAAEATIVLVHGYCAGQNEFPPSHFTNAVQFQDYKQARSNDDFALRIKAFGDQFPAFTIVAHSQGGLAAAHLHTYYWSNLEQAFRGRLIQSVGSPYYGSGLAGTLASIGRIFGLGCGRNNDLTYDGAGKWAAGIPAAVASDVHYYTTQYEEGFLKHWCVFGASLVLYKPNDGTTELNKAKLAGGNHAGHKHGWCHTNGMKYGNQCADPDRNKEMNTLAARAIRP